MDDDLQLKDLLNRSDVRTMKKDLRSLREGVALEEREKIIKIKPPEIEKAAKEAAEEPRQEKIREELAKQKRVLSAQGREDIATMAQIKEFSNENEQQQIFYLESEISDLNKKLDVLQREKEPPVLLQKNHLMLEGKDVESGLIALLKEEKRAENEERFITEQEKKSNAPSDVKNLEKKRWEIENKREKLEKERWVVEKQLKAIDEKVAVVDEEYQKILEEQKALEDKLAELNETLRTVYAAVRTRIEQERAAQKAQTTEEAQKRAETTSLQQEETRRQQWGGVSHKQTLAGSDVEETAKKQRIAERIQRTATREEEERKKFMQNVEDWSKENKK